MTDSPAPQGITVSSNQVHRNPLFVHASPPFDFHLTAGSPARNAGVSLTSVPNDFDGRPRPRGQRFDLGAYQYAKPQKP